MTYPTFPGNGSILEESNSRTNHIVPFPATVNAGDTLLVALAFDDYFGNPANCDPPGSGWARQFYQPLAYKQGQGYVNEKSDYNITAYLFMKEATGSEGGGQATFSTSRSCLGAAKVHRMVKPAGGTYFSGDPDGHFDGEPNCPPSPNAGAAGSRGDHYDYTFLSIYWREAKKWTAGSEPANFTLLGHAESGSGALAASVGMAYIEKAHGNMPGSGGETDNNGYVTVPGQWDHGPWAGLDTASKLTIAMQLAITDNVYHA